MDNTFEREPSAPGIDTDVAIRRVLEGDNRFFRDIVAQYQRKLHAYCFHMLSDPQEAEDATQEIFIKCYRNLSAYEANTSFSAWMYKIAYNHCLNVLRKRSGWRRFLASYRPPADSAPPPNENAAFVADLLNRLTPGERHLLLLRAIEDKTFEEIAAITAKKPAALRKKFERLRRKLQHAFGAKEELELETKWSPIGRH